MSENSDMLNGLDARFDCISPALADKLESGALSYAPKLTEGRCRFHALREPDLAFIVAIIRAYPSLRAERNLLSADYQRIIREVLACDPQSACDRADEQLEPPWEVIARVRAERDSLREELRVQDEANDILTKRVQRYDALNFSPATEASIDAMIAARKAAA